MEKQKIRENPRYQRHPRSKLLFACYPVFSRPPLGGIDDGAGGFAQDERAALFGNDGAALDPVG